MSDEPVKSEQVNEVIQLVRRLSDDGNVQLSIMARAFIIGCLSLKVDSDHALTLLDELFAAEDMELVPIKDDA